MTSPEKTTAPKRPVSNQRRAAYIIAGGAALVAATFSVQAIAENKMVRHAFVGAQASNPFTQTASANGYTKQAKWFRGERVRFADMSDEQVEKRVNRMVRHLSIEIDATKEQEDKITALAAAVAKDMRSVRKEWRSVGEDMLDTLTSNTVDRAKLETLRTARIADADARSRQIVKALADVSEVLTTEQRATLKDRISKFRERGRHGRWHRG